MHHPPGRKVYQRGAHTIWEVDGALQKVRELSFSLQVLIHILADADADVSVRSCIAKIFLCSGSSSLMLRRCSSTARTVRDYTSTSSLESCVSSMLISDFQSCSTS